MKKLKIALSILFLISLVSTSQAQSQSQLEKDLAELRSWMRTRSVQADSMIKNEWPNVKKEYKNLTYSLDGQTKKLSEKSKAEYTDIKQQYQEWEAENEKVETVDLDGHELERWERTMTGTTKIDKIKAVKLRDAYISLLDYTREQRRSWSPKDWEYAEFVFGELNARKADVFGELTNSDKIKIAALQVEFATLKKSREAKDAYDNRRKAN